MKADMEDNKIHVGIGFVTGRKNFKNVAKAYLDSWKENTLADQKKYALHLFVAYDLKYFNTEVKDYTGLEDEIPEAVESIYYLNGKSIIQEARELVDDEVETEKGIKLIFGEGYAMKRNMILYSALKQNMDYLIFLDDDEYPVANIQMEGSIVWKGQEVLKTHIQNLQFADMTHGHHCGYISPIPHIPFNETFTENDFRIFIEAISNDIITWDSIKEKMNNGGVSSADLHIIDSKKIEFIQEIGGMKFISGANLGINLQDPSKIFPFYNPPGARGEDTFLSTCIGGCNIRKVPCYTFHDGFLAYKQLLKGVLPNKLRSFYTSSPAIYKRFLNASIGWIRYKPLLLFITNEESYAAKIKEIRQDLNSIIPKMCVYFGNDDFKILIKELDFFDANVRKHYKDFQDTKAVWSKISRHITKGNITIEQEKQKLY